MHSKIKAIFLVFIISFSGSMYGTFSIKSMSFKNILKCLFCCFCFDKKKNSCVCPVKIAFSKDNLNLSMSQQQLALEKHFEEELEAVLNEALKKELEEQQEFKESRDDLSPRLKKVSEGEFFQELCKTKIKKVRFKEN